MMLACSVALTLALADGTGSNKGWKGGSTTAGRVRSNAPETKLVGISLYDDGLKLVRVFGSPDEIQALGTGGGGQTGPAGATGVNQGGGPGGGPGGGQRGGGGGGGGAQTVSSTITRPIDWGTTEFFVQGGRGRGDEDAGLTGGSPQGGGAPQLGGVSGAGGGGGQGPGGGGAAAGGQGSARILFTRWIYKRGNSRFGFILDKMNHVIQIEAIGSADSRVYTNRGIRYGSQVKDIIARYGAPDAYEIAGDQIVMRYLIKDKVAFRLNRLKTDKPHVVTGIVVAAGKA